VSTLCDAVCIMTLIGRNNICRNGKTYRMHPYVLLAWDKFETKETAKHREWIWMNSLQLADEILLGNLDPIIIDTNWFDFSSEIFFESDILGSRPVQRAPCWYLNECKEIADLALFIEFRQYLLANMRQN